MTFDPTDAVPVLERTPATLRAMLSGLPATWSDATEGTGSWSPRAIVAHLLHAERTNWIPRARVLLDEGPARVLPSFDPTGQFDGTADRSLVDLLHEFALARARSIETLAAWSIGSTALQRTAEHPELGAVTLGELLATWVAHDLSHIAQIARVMARQYRDAVGPWRAYLPIMEKQR